MKENERRLGAERVRRDWTFLRDMDPLSFFSSTFLAMLHPETHPSIRVSFSLEVRSRHGIIPAQMAGWLTAYSQTVH